MLSILISCMLFGINTESSNAEWHNYGEGYKGTNGIPFLVLDTRPRICTEGNICIGNSSGQPNYGLFFIGVAPGFTPTEFCGNLLISCNPYPLVSKLITIPKYELNLHVFYPCLNDRDLIGTHFYLQVLQLDFGAAHGVSFTPGLDMKIGH